MTAKKLHPKKAGRKGLYKPEYCKKIVDWFKLKRNDCVPAWFEDFAEEIGVCDSSLTNWIKVYPEFLHAYTICKHIQKAILADGGITGKFNAAMAFNALKNVSGWRDKSQLEMEGGTDDKLHVTVSFTKDKPKV